MSTVQLNEKNLIKLERINYVQSRNKKRYER